MNRTTGETLQLTLATGAFAVCFAIFGSVSAMMPLLKKSLKLSPVEVSIALAIPVLLGSLGRIPLGILTDRFGGRLIFSVVMILSIIPSFLMGFVSNYTQFLVCAFFMGIALASFAVGVSFVSKWYSSERQGMALGVYGAGTMGQSFAAFGAPTVASLLGYKWGFWFFTLLALLWLILFLIASKNAPKPSIAKSLGERLAPLKESMSWVLSLFYFLTFGGFVAMSIYLPTFLTEVFGLTAKDAGFRTAGFVVLSTSLRPVGGILADRVGGNRILMLIFPVVGLMAVLMSFTYMATFTIGALGMAAAIGLGNGAVFKLVPEHFPQDVGSVTGLVGAAGGLGGFFPPLALGNIRQLTGSFTGGFILLGLFSVICFLVSWKTGGRLQQKIASA
ncbi:MAG: NarK/NasA family nitrate transporter [Blastocatellia bacterium]|nr:NarK/NasA family nitrate transporter [Blastocatellia bacterium]